ncbi:thioredoxin family protein [Telluribacter sp. SYSU D00476]|uniref:thioredoxin family protein n=1 Tax=Telluribacter sp. SYSU D00476 TaxID=2811430 RepID=UPI001FF207E7|nr:thioredoxin family protein [Telluribacter sp. SYSU D00476]
MKRTIMLGVMSALLFATFGFLPPAEGYQPGDRAMPFKYRNKQGQLVALRDNVSAKGYIIVFTCNTCPVAQAYEQRVLDLDKQFASKGFPVIAINPNDSGRSWGDSYEDMKERAIEKKYTFPYLVDANQELARTYGARHTPTVYVVQRQGNSFIVRFTGAIDNNMEDGSQATKKYVQDAVNALLENKPVAIPTTKAIGCSIKWKNG